MKNIKFIRAAGFLLALCITLTSCGKNGISGKKDANNENPYSNMNIKKLSEITTATDSDYNNALVAETKLYADSLVNTGSVKYKEKADLPDISDKFPEYSYKDYSYKDFKTYIGDGFKKSGASPINDNWESFTAADSKVFEIDFGKDFEIKSITVKWAGKTAVKGSVQVSDDKYAWYDSVDRLVLTASKNQATADVNETHRRYLRLYFPTAIDISLVSDVVIKGCPSNQTAAIPEGEETNGIARPVVYPYADKVDGVKEPIISLGGTWKYTAEPQDGFWKNDADVSKWTDVPVPGDPDNLNVGVRTKHKNNLDGNYPTVFRLCTSIPADYKNKEIILQFEGINYYSRIFVNGQLVRTHRGSATAFACLITDYVEPGKDAVITVEATFEIVSGESNLYQGIVGYPKLMAVPKESICRVQTETDFDASYTNATLNVSAAAFSRSNPEGKFEISLKDPDGKEVFLKNTSAAFKGENNRDTVITNEIKNVQKYDDEHPRLYTLTVSAVSKDGKTTETLTKKVGFKKITISGNQLLVNGKSVKLRGADWNNLSPNGGLVADYWSDRASLIKLAAANVNYIRTAHHPQYSYVFDICDELGIYVEEECGIAMVCQWTPSIYEKYEKLCNPAESDYYLTYYANMVEGSRSHASLLFYSLGNESDWGANIEAGRDYIKAVDGKHPTKFSWGKLQPSETSTDIFSVHYPTVGEIYNNTATTVPYIYDEYAHVYGHNRAAYYEDPSVPEQWDLEKLWNLIYKQAGGLGGAIWHSRDMATMTPKGAEKYFVRYWGILDTWNREKEEYWITKTAYSPVHIDDDKVYDAPASGTLSIPVENRYQNTNLNEITLECTVNGKKTDVKMPDIAATKTGNIEIKHDGFKNGDVVRLIFRNNNGKLSNLIVNEYEFTLGGRKGSEFSGASGDAPTVNNADGKITVSGKNFNIVFDKSTGKITDGKVNGKTTVIGGPDLNLGRFISLTKWKLNSISCAASGSEAIITVSGSYSEVSSVTFNIKIDGTGRMNTEFSAALPGGSVEEIGVTYVMPLLKEFSWKSDVYRYSVLPDYSVARLNGTAVPYREGSATKSPLDTPLWQKLMDTVTPGIADDGTSRFTDDFRARKHNLFYSQYVTKDNTAAIFEADGKSAARVATVSDNKEAVKVMLSCKWGHIQSAGEFAAVYDEKIQSSGNFSGNIVLRLSAEKVYDK